MERAPDTPHSKYQHVYPIVRIDTPIDQTDPTSRITVVKVLTSQVAAEAEVSRLNQVNAEKSCIYFCCTSRLIEQSMDSPKLVESRFFTNLPRAAALHCHPLGEKTVKRRREETVIRVECGVSALVHATPGATASRFAGRSANRTTPITRNTITSVKFRWTP